MPNCYAAVSGLIIWPVEMWLISRVAASLAKQRAKARSGKEMKAARKIQMHPVTVRGHGFFRQHPGAPLMPQKKKEIHGCRLPWLSKMAESASVREPCIISWQSHINNKAHNAKCECLCLRKDAQQVHLSSPRFHFVQQRAPLCQRLLSESFGWSFFYVPLPRMHNIHGTSW